MIEAFSDEQARALVNLEQRYDVWMQAERALRRLPYDLRRKTVSGRDYLYRIEDRSGNGVSLGPWSPEAERTFTTYQADKAAAKARRETSRAALDETCRLCRALRTPRIASEAAAILREADRRGLLGQALLVVGTNAMPVYSIEAGAFIRDAPEETDDFDLAWTAPGPPSDAPSVWPMLKQVDPTFTVNSERLFQARNAKAYEVEIVVAPSRAGGLARRDQPRPVPLAEQEWLLNGRMVDRVVIGRDGSPARIVAPDPRWFALQKLWMSEQAKRNPLKRPKDFRQGMALLDAVDQAMPHYPLDQAFKDELPAELTAPFRAWRARAPERPPSPW